MTPPQLPEHADEKGSADPLQDEERGNHEKREEVASSHARALSGSTAAAAAAISSKEASPASRTRCQCSAGMLLR